MSITFFADAEREGLNLSNVNAADLMRWLGYEPDCCGSLEARELAARCRRRLWPEARNFDAALAGEVQRAPGRATFIYCGRRAGYLRERTSQLLALAESPGVTSIHFG